MKKKKKKKKNVLPDQINNTKVITKLLNQIMVDCKKKKGLVITVEFPVIIVLVPGLGKAVKSSYELT